MVQPDHYAKRISTSLQINGDLTKHAWQNALWSNRFVDMVTGDAGIYNTQCALLWNASFLYIAFIAEEPFLEAKMVEKGSMIFFRK